MEDLLLFGGFAAAGYVLAIYTWPTVRTFLAGAEQEIAWLKSRVADIEAKVRDLSAGEADMDWGDLAKTIISLGAPVIGQALAGPFGAVAGHLLAQALGAAETTPHAVNAAIAAVGPGAALAAALLAEEKWAAAIGAEADAAKAQVTAVGETQRAEIGSGDLLQRWWRPLYALELSMFECPAFAVTLLHALWTGFAPAINGFATLSGLLMAYFAARFGVLGVYVSGRSREKQASVTGQPVPGVVGQVVKAVTRK